MGAAVTIELVKPLDGSDIINIEIARNEVIRLRTTLGHLAQLGGFSGEIVLDASDIVLGENETDDFNRCLQEIIHIRRCLQLHTQNSKRRDRGYERKIIEDNEMDGGYDDYEDSDDDA